jgi:hypothetical protein
LVKAAEALMCLFDMPAIFPQITPYEVDALHFNQGENSVTEILLCSTAVFAEGPARV